MDPGSFSPLIRHRWLVAHRWLGRLYCFCVAVGWIAFLPIAFHAASGPIASAGFLLLGAVWIASTAIGDLTVRRGRMLAHREWMIRSYALTAAAITLRLYLPVLIALGVSPPVSYRISAWACWALNLLFAEWLIRRSSPAPLIR